MQRRMHEMTKAAVHVYFPGSHGTTQELLESVHLNIMALEAGEKPKDIIIFNPAGYNEAPIFDVDLEYIDKILSAKGYDRKAIHLQTASRIADVEEKVKSCRDVWKPLATQPSVDNGWHMSIR